MLKSGHCPEGGGGSGLVQIAWSTFFMDKGNCLIFVLLEYYRGIIGVLCVISLQFIGFSNTLFKSGTSILIRGESAPRVPKFHRGAPPNFDNAQI